MPDSTNDTDNLESMTVTASTNHIDIANVNATCEKEGPQEGLIAECGVEQHLTVRAEVENIEPSILTSLRQRTPKLISLLQQAQAKMSNLKPNAAEASLIEQQARQFMGNYVPQRTMPTAPAATSSTGQRPVISNGTAVPYAMTNMSVQMAMPPYAYHIMQQPYPVTLQLPPHLQRPPGAIPPPAAAQQLPVRTVQRKCERLLINEVEALKMLVLKLAALGPEVRNKANMLIAQSELLSQMDWVSTNENLASRFYGNANAMQAQTAATAARRIDGGSENVSRQQQQNGGRSRRESEKSNNSNSSAPLASQQQQQKECGPSSDKRNRKKRASARKDTPHSQKSELEAMRTYINTIVQHHVGAMQLLPPELHFAGDFDDLEAHAQRLVAAGYGRIVEDEIRVNRKNNRQSFITMSANRETLERDGIVPLPVARRYAFDGDTVRAFVLNVGAAVTKVSDATGGINAADATSLSLTEEEELSDETESQDSDVDNAAVIQSDNCPKAFVIAIIKQTDLRQIVGTISFTNPTKLCDDQLFYKFRPYDLRVPMVYIPHATCDKHIGNKAPEEVCGLLYLAHILETDCNGHCIAELVQPVGRVGNLSDELKAILFHNGLRDVVPFEQRFNDMFAEQEMEKVSASDLGQRLDLRKSCIFTIDPATARDLDDALSIERLADNRYEVGVHISDVSHYLTEDSELDNIVKERSTSIYLANEVIHMLPQTLCMHCSLLPGKDKMAFSVFWQLDGEGKELGPPRFTRSIINSCTQLAYEDAQKVIDNPRERFEPSDFPNILNGVQLEDVLQRVRWLHGIASKMRGQRFDQGALTIDNAKLRFTLDPLSGEPQGFEVEQQREANRMIEEFMLLANQTVAHFIHKRFPNIAVLRNHAPPLTKSMKSLAEKLQALGLHLDYSSSKSVQESMVRMCKQARNPEAMSACLSQLLMKPMARAKYFCSDGKTDVADLWHYALSIPIYTHFTSPIRRYPDILVHRLLAAALDYCPAPARSVDELHALTQVANVRKYNAKMAGEDSTNLFFKRYVRNKHGLVMRAVVMEIFQHMMNVVTLESGHVISINFKLQKVVLDTQNVPNFILISDRNSKMPPAKLKLLSMLPVRLMIWDNKLTGFLLAPELRKTEQQQHEQVNRRASSEQPFTSGSSSNSCNQKNKQKQQQQQKNNNNSTANANNMRNRSNTQRNNSTNCNNNNNNTNNQRLTQTQQEQQPRYQQQQQQRAFVMRQNSL